MRSEQVRDAGVTTEQMQSKAAMVVEDLVCRTMLKLAPTDFSNPRKSETLSLLNEIASALKAAEAVVSSFPVACGLQKACMFCCGSFF